MLRKFYIQTISSQVRCIKLIGNLWKVQFFKYYFVHKILSPYFVETIFQDTKISPTDDTFFSIPQNTNEMTFYRSQRMRRKASK